MSESDGRVVGTEKIVDHGPDSDRWTLVVVGDGYRETELDNYHEDVENFVSTFRSTPPFDEFFSAINIYRIDVVSNETGADDPGCGTGPQVAASTFFDATYCTFGIERLLTIDMELALSVADAEVPARNEVLCIVNTSKYGGSGGIDMPVAVCSTAPTAAQIAIHEMGHTFELADEYGGSAVHIDEPEFPNLTLDPHAINKWDGLILEGTPTPTMCNPNCAASTCVPPGTTVPVGTVGTYEGGGSSSCNIYRPTRFCKMGSTNEPFCPVCLSVIRGTLQSFLPS